MAEDRGPGPTRSADGGGTSAHADGGHDLAELLDRVRWDYDERRESLSPLTTTERFFRDFPWDG